MEDRIKDYPFFSYFMTETLKMEPSEWGRISQLLTQLRHELQENEDSPAFRAVVLAGVTPVQSRVGYSATNKALYPHLAK